MPRNGSGTFTLSDTIAAATAADANEVQAILNDIATALTASAAANGETPITGQLKGFVSANPCYAFDGDSNTGFGSDAADQPFIKAGGTKILAGTAAGIVITGTLSVSGLITPTGGFTGALIANGTTAGFVGLEAVTTDAGAAGAIVSAYHNSASPAALDEIAAYEFNGKDSAGNKTTYARLLGRIEDPTNGSEDATLFLQAMIAGVLTTMLQTSPAGVTLPGALTVGTGLTVLAGAVSLPAASIELAELATTAKAFQNQLLHVQDQKASGTGGGSFANAADRTRDLNTVVTNEITGASLATNQITLPAGTYWIEASAPGLAVDVHRVKLHNVTDATDALLGLNACTGNGAALLENRSFLCGRFTIAVQKAFELRHRCQTTNAASNGRGNPSNWGETEYYAEVKVWKVG